MVSDALPFGRLWYGEPNAIENAIGYAKFRSRSHDAVIRVSFAKQLGRFRTGPKELPRLSHFDPD